MEGARFSTFVQRGFCGDAPARGNGSKLMRHIAAKHQSQQEWQEPSTSLNCLDMFPCEHTSKNSWNTVCHGKQSHFHCAVCDMHGTPRPSALPHCHTTTHRVATKLFTTSDVKLWPASLTHHSLLTGCKWPPLSSMPPALIRAA